MGLPKGRADWFLYQKAPETVAAKGVRLLVGSVSVLLIAIAAYLAHLSLASAVPVLLLSIIVIAIRWGFLQATVASMVAVACLDFLFAPPLFHFSIGEADDWVALLVFEATALLVSRLSWRVGRHVREQELQRENMTKLYDFSNAILLIDGRTSTVEQLCALLREIFLVDAVSIWRARDTLARPGMALTKNEDAARQVYDEGRDGDDPTGRRSWRMLRMGTTAIGAMVLEGWEVDPSVASAAASLVAVALERARSLQQEAQAEAARNTEQLRTAVLDALAHGFKTPLTAIQTASSGLLTIGQLGETQTELASIIDQEVTLLSRLTTRLLQTAAFDAREIRVRSSVVSLSALLRELVEEQDRTIRERIRLELPDTDLTVQADGQLVKLAIAQLIDNAAKYSDVGSLITVALLQEGTQSSIVVRNAGEPIPPADRTRIFERFHRGAFATRGPTGTGLGLSIVKRIAEAHHGTVSVVCDGGQVQFSFTLSTAG